MRIGAALTLIAVGAILRFGIAVTMTHGFDLQIIGDILIGVGLLGLILWLIVWAPRSRDSGGPGGYRQPTDLDTRQYPPASRTPREHGRDEVSYDDDYRR